MRKDINKICVCIFAITFILLTSCKKLVSIDVPITQLASKSVFSDNATATLALLNIYQDMYKKHELYIIDRQTGLTSDELKNFSNDNSNIALYTNNLNSLDNYSPWQDAYYFIYQANSILEALSNNVSLGSTVVRQISGEAKFIRAFWHFYLMNFFGDIPLVLTTDYSINRLIPRSSKKEVYDQVIKDLSDAANSLSDQFVDASDTTVTQERVRPTKWAAMALLARVYLYLKDYANAEKQANLVISNASQFSLEPDLNKVFLANSSESIWQLATPLSGGSNGGMNTTDGYMFILHAAPTDVAISSQLLNAFESGDDRRNKWIDSIVISRVAYYFPYKYKIYSDFTPDVTDEYTMILRLSEQYLIRAEARIQQDRTAEGIGDLNVIRERARIMPTGDIPDPLPDLSTSLSKTDALKAVLHERQVELFIEGGHRWFDMIRMGYAGSIMGPPGNVCQLKGGVWNSNWELFPIGQSDRNLNPNLTQNAGY